MAGHSKWANIKIRKGAQDAKRGKAFTKVSREIIVAARSGGGDPDMNPRLRLAISKAREVNMPKDTIERAVKKGTGELEGEDYQEVVYEGYGPNGVALMIEALTDNRQRTAPEIRALLDKRGGNLGDPGCVAWMFEAKGLVSIKAEGVDEDELLMTALEAGAEDIKTEGDTIAVTSNPEVFMDVRQAIEDAGYSIINSELARVPTSTVALDGKTAPAVLQLMDELDDLDDVQKVHANFDVDDAVLESIAETA
ncbi:MAG: YebC/PmpR family DNA-binding transcriptional regulator [Armatimonadia bacterium]|nr:YebC/PmpR family DNA-binding transcriptional regulator [Armatimonadia bacterium]